MGLNKVDILSRSELSSDKIDLIRKLEQDSIQIFELSTVTQQGIVELRNKVFTFYLWFYL